MRQVINVVGAVPATETRLALALAGQPCNAGGIVFVTDLSVNTEGLTAMTLNSTLAAGIYTICYSVNEGIDYTSQVGPTLTIVAASASDIPVVAPSTVAALTTPTLSFAAGSLLAAPTSVIGFSELGAPIPCDTVFAVSPVTLSINYHAPMSSGLPPIATTMEICYSVDGGLTWVPQPATVDVAVATPDTITGTLPGWAVR